MDLFDAEARGQATLCLRRVQDRKPSGQQSGLMRLTCVLLRAKPEFLWPGKFPAGSPPPGGRVGSDAAPSRYTNSGFAVGARGWGDQVGYTQVFAEVCCRKGSEPAKWSPEDKLGNELAAVRVLRAVPASGVAAVVGWKQIKAKRNHKFASGEGFRPS